MAAAVTNALRSAEMSPVEVGYVNAHGTGTADNDPAETAALKTVFGAGSVPLLSSTKGTTGHALGASGESRRWPPLLGGIASWADSPGPVVYERSTASST